MQHISTSYWTHAGLLRSVREAVVPENKRLDKKSILINPIVLVTRAPNLHSRNSRKDIQDLKKTDLLTCGNAADYKKSPSRRGQGATATRVRFATAPNAPETKPNLGR